MPELATNSFEVFSSQERGHENHLTRALLVLLRTSPLAHEVWLRQLGLGEVGLTGVGEPSFAFQTSSVPGLDADVQEHSARGISVFVTREAAENMGDISPSSDRRMIPDGLVTYPSGEVPIVVVVESKVGEAADARQAREVNLGGVRAEWDPPIPINLRWAVLIDELWALLELGAAAASEARLLLDFFDFVDHYYREVGPYSTLRRCRGISERIRRRCRAILGEATALEARPPARGRGPYVEIEGPKALPRLVQFDITGDKRAVQLSFWPGDTPTQARAFYSDPAVLDCFLNLADEPGWRATPNMHFGHFQAGYAWLPVTETTSVADYVRFWRDNLDCTATVYRPPQEPDWDSLLSKLAEAGIVASREDFDQDFVETGRNKADVRPGVRLDRTWPLERAIGLDDAGKLVDEISDAFGAAMQCFGDPI